MSDAKDTLLRGLPGFQPAEPGDDPPADDTARDDGPGPGDEAPVKRGPQFPDLFERAMSQSHVPDLVSISADGSRRVDDASPAPAARGTRANAPAMAGAGAPSDSSSGEIGPFTGASAKRRRRWGR